MSAKPNDTLKMMTSGMALWVDTVRGMQDRYVNAVASAAENAPGSIGWKTMEIPVLTVNLSGAGSPEKRLKESFQRSANRNIEAWTHAANMLQAVPSWAKWPTHIQSRKLTDQFDKLRPKPSYPAPKAKP